MKSVSHKISLTGILMLLSACAHYPSQYSTYSSSNTYSPSNRGYQQPYNQYNYYPSRQPSYYGYSRPYSGSYQSNYYYQNNNVYNPPRPSKPWNYGHDHHDHPSNYPPSNGYGYPHSGWDNRRDEHDHHSNWNGDHHDNRYQPQPQPITIRNEDKQYIHIDNHLNNGGNNQHSSNWMGGHNNNQPQPRPQTTPVHHDDNHGRPRDNAPNNSWGNSREDHHPNTNQWGAGQVRNDPPATRQQIGLVHHDDHHSVARGEEHQRHELDNHGNSPQDRKNDQYKSRR